jgi:hypothetical protein
MRRTIPLIVLVLALLALAACSAAGLPAPEEATLPAPEAQVPEAPAPETPAVVALPEQFVGIYTASLPAADTPGREITVELAADGQVVVTSDYLNDQPPIVETGTWAGNADGAVTATLTAQDGQEYFEPRTFLVGLEGDELLVSGEGGQVVHFVRSTGAEAPAVIVGEAVTTTTVITDSRGQAVTTIEVTQSVTITAPLAAAPVITETVDLTNTYLALLPAASGGSTRLLALSLFADGAAQWSTEFSGEDTPNVETGAWVDNGDETISVTLTGNAEGNYETPVVVTFQREGDLLKTVGSEDLFGADGLTLQLAADVVSQVGPSLVSIDLEAGFPLDPTFVSVQGGGEIDASLLSSECVGYVNRYPVVTLNWSGDAPFVEAFFVSDSDPTLAILTPDGQLLCNDDANEDLLDPVIEISEPVTGSYQIWVGSYAKGQLIPGVLVLTTDPEVNIGTFNLGALIRRPLVPEVQAAPKLAATREAALTAINDLKADAVTAAPDGQPVSVSLTLSGTIPLFEMGLPDPVCNGLVSGTPDFVFDWTGDGEPFTLFFEGDGDSTLLVLSGDGELLACGDDAEAGVNLNPQVTVSDAKPGLYGVWVGRLDPAKPVLGRLTVVAGADAAPAPLGPVQ